MPSFTDQTGCQAGLVTAVDLIRGLGVLTGIDVVEVPGATGWFDTDYEGKRDAALRTLDAGADLFLIHVEATDEAGHAGNLEEKVKALENWDRRILADLVTGLDAMGPWRMLLLPDHPTPVELKTPHHRLGALPPRRLRHRRPRRHLHRTRHRGLPAGPGPPAHGPPRRPRVGPKSRASSDAAAASAASSCAARATAPARQ